MWDYIKFLGSSLSDRMENISTKYNLKCDYYKPHIITIKSKQILSYLKKVSLEDSCFDEKLKKISYINDLLINVCKNIYIKYDPNLIYCFQNEINLVFFYKDNGNYLFDGNINNLLTILTSDITLQINKRIQDSKLNVELNDVLFTGKFIEFSKDYETLNYIIWRQVNCKRNTLSLFYKCLYTNKDINGIGIKEMEEYLEKVLKDIQIFLTGNIIKKILYYKTKTNTVYEDEQITTRRGLCIENFYLHENFKENYNKYIKNKFM